MDRMVGGMGRPIGGIVLGPPKRPSTAGKEVLIGPSVSPAVRLPPVTATSDSGGAVKRTACEKCNGGVDRACGMYEEAARR